MSDESKPPPNMVPVSIPVSYQDPYGNRFYQNAPIVSSGVSKEEMELYSSQNVEVCGNCRHFERAHGQAILARTRFVRSLVKDYEWKPEHAGLTRETAGEMGLCGDRGDMATSAMCKSCENFRPLNGRVKKETEAADTHRFLGDLRAANADSAERFRQFKRDRGLEDAVIIPDDE